MVYRNNAGKLGFWLHLCSCYWHLELSHAMKSAGVTPSFCTFPLLTCTIKPWYHSRPCPEYSVWMQTEPNRRLSCFSLLSCIYFAKQVQRSSTLENTHTNTSLILNLFHYLSLTHSLTHIHAHTRLRRILTDASLLHKANRRASLPSTYVSASMCACQPIAGSMETRQWLHYRSLIRFRDKETEIQMEGWETTIFHLLSNLD